MVKTNYVYFNAYIKDNSSIFQICEDSEEYEITTPNNMHDKLFRDLLSDKKELAIFLNEYLGLDISEDELEKYNSSFVTKNYENSEADIVYKLKDKNVFILIEHQSSADKSMPFRLLNYNLEIIKDTNDGDSYKTDSYIYAKVIPIVVYTGGTKWNVSKKFSTLQEHYGKNNYLELKYNLIDINNYDKEKLLRGRTMIEKAMLIEKKLLDYLIEIGYSKVECDKIKKYNLMEILYISNIVNCGIEEIKMYDKTFTFNDNIFNETRTNLKKCFDKEELLKYNFTNSKKYIYGIIYSTYLHQKLSEEEINELLNTNMKFGEFIAKYKSDNIYKSYDKEYRNSI